MLCANASVVTELDCVCTRGVVWWPFVCELRLTQVAYSGTKLILLFNQHVYIREAPPYPSLLLVMPPYLFMAFHAVQLLPDHRNEQHMVYGSYLHSIAAPKLPKLFSCVSTSEPASQYSFVASFLLLGCRFSSDAY